MTDIHETVLTCPETGCDWHTRWSTSYQFLADSDVVEAEHRGYYQEHWLDKHAPPGLIPDPVVTQETWT